MTSFKSVSDERGNIQADTNFFKELVKEKH